MSKRLILILALAFVVGITFAAYAEVQNVKVSGDIAVKGVARNNLSLTKAPVVATDFGSIRGVVSQARVRIDADLTDNVATTVRLLNERVWGEETDELTTPSTSTKSNNSEIDLDLAYVTMKEFLYSPLSLSVGRQELRFGNGLVVGDPDTNAVASGHGSANRYLPNSLDDLSSRKAFDAVRATLDYNPLVVDFIYSKISESNIKAFDDVNLYGANANYAVNKNLVTEGYIFQRARDTGVGIAATTGGAPAKKEKLTTVGARADYTGFKDLSLGLEGAYQFGDHLATTAFYPDEANDGKLTRKVTAFALQAAGSYKVPRMTKYSPMLGGSYTYLSGDKADSTNDHFRGWDPMFEDQNRGTLFNKIFALTNMQIVNLNASAKPMEDVTFTVNYYNLMAVVPFVEEIDLTKTLSRISGDPAYTMELGKKDLGNEVDLGITYDYTEDVQFGLSAGAFIPGGAFAKANKETAKQVIGSMKVTF